MKTIHCKQIFLKIHTVSENIAQKGDISFSEGNEMLFKQILGHFNIYFDISHVKK